MPIRFRCPHCNQLMGIARRKSGSMVHCPTCSTSVLVPATDEVEEGPAPPAAPAAPLAPPPARELFERDDFDALLGGQASGVAEPDNKLACCAMADLLEEEGRLDLAFCYRWMGWYARRPGHREGPRLQKRIVWYKEGAFEDWPNNEVDRYNSPPAAWLTPIVYLSLG